MLKPRSLLRGDITYDTAKDSDANILHELGYRDQKIRFFTYLYRNRELIKSLITRHLGLASRDSCHLVDVEDWIHGSFNVCIRADVFDSIGAVERQVMIRFPLPYRIGEDYCPGNADEKVRCEVGTYTWLKENCPTVPIPHLYGYGLSSGRTFIEFNRLPFFFRNIERLRRVIMRTLGYRVPSFYTENSHKYHNLLEKSYIIIEYVSQSSGNLLSETWEEGRFNPTLRSNLFRGLSRIILAMVRVPLPKIGSFVVDDDGYLSLNNRPLTMELQQLENERIPVNIHRDTTYLGTESYIHDALSLHESRLRHQPNAVNSREDGLYQTSALMVMRSIWPCLFNRELFRGPFLFNLTDLNQTNIFVDNKWNIVQLIDLEWACSHPAEMIHPPYWLTNQAIDLIDSSEYEALHTEFMNTFVEEQRTSDTLQLYPTIKNGLENGTFWYSLALTSPSAFSTIFYDHIQPKFTNGHGIPEFWKITMPYFSLDTAALIEQKVKDKERYDADLEEAFRC